MADPRRTPWPSSVLATEVPAHEDFVASLRAMTRAAAALADLPVDAVEDLQMAVDEAATVLLPLVAPEGDRRLRATFEVSTSGLAIELRARCRPGEQVDRSGLAWMMLTALDAGVDVIEHDDEVAIAIGRTGPAGD